MLNAENISQAEPDWLDLACGKVQKALEGITPEDQLMVLEQCIEYLRHEIPGEEARRPCSS